MQFATPAPWKAPGKKETPSNEKPAAPDFDAESILRRVATSKKVEYVSGKHLGAVVAKGQELGYSGGATSVHPALIAAAKENGGKLEFEIASASDLVAIRPTANKTGTYYTIEFQVEGLPPQNALAPRGVDTVEAGQTFTCLVSSQNDEQKVWNYTLS